MTGGIAHVSSLWSWRSEEFTRWCQNPRAFQAVKFCLVTTAKGAAVRGGSRPAQNDSIPYPAGRGVPKDTSEDGKCLLDLIAP